MSPCSPETDAPPDSARGPPQKQLSHWRGPAAAAASASHNGGFAVTGPVLQFLWGRKGRAQMCCMEKNSPNALMNTAEHQSHSGISSSLENTPALLKHKGFILSRILTSGRKRMRVAFALLQLPSLLGGYKSSPTWNKTQYFWLKEKYTHGTASGGFLKLFKGKWKGWWLPLGEQLLHLQFTVSTGSLTREEDVWWQNPWATATATALLSCSIALQK